MKYQIQLKPKALKDLKAIRLSDRKRIVERMNKLTDNLQGDVKKLTSHSPEYRLRSGKFRILFEIEEQQIVIYRVYHRKEAYL